jgi:REP element-mobilizing transposase RayT
LTICTHGRQPAFLDADIVAQTLSRFRNTAKAESFEILAYCLMPDHGHWLIEGTSETANFLRFAKLAKQRSGAAHARKSGTRLWQEGYWERVLRPEEDLKEIAGYIVNNPVRAGLVATASEYPYSGSDIWSLEDLIESVM